MRRVRVRRQSRPVLGTSSGGDVRHDPCKLWSQFHGHCGRRDSLRARRGSVWADRPRGWAGPGPHLDPTSAPSHILAAQVTGGSGRREQRARRGRGTWSAHRPSGAVARPRLWRGVVSGRRELHWLLSTLCSQSGPLEGSTGRGTCARQWACPWACKRRGGNRSRERGAQTHDVRGWRAAV